MCMGLRRRCGWGCARSAPVAAWRVASMRSECVLSLGANVHCSSSTSGPRPALAALRGARLGADRAAASRPEMALDRQYAARLSAPSAAVAAGAAVAADAGAGVAGADVVGAAGAASCAPRTSLASWRAAAPCCGSGCSQSSSSPGGDPRRASRPMRGVAGVPPSQAPRSKASSWARTSGLPNGGRALGAFRFPFFGEGTAMSAAAMAAAAAAEAAPPAAVAATAGAPAAARAGAISEAAQEV